MTLTRCVNTCEKQIRSFENKFDEVTTCSSSTSAFWRRKAIVPEGNGFSNAIQDIYPKLQLKKNMDSPFIFIYWIHLYDKRDNFNFNIVNIGSEYPTCTYR